MLLKVQGFAASGSQDLAIVHSGSCNALKRLEISSKTGNAETPIPLNSGLLVHEGSMP